MVWHESFGFVPWLKLPASLLAGDAQGGGSPLVGGAGSIDACQRFVLASSVLPAWGEPARPGLPPEGETGKGALNSLLPQADCLATPSISRSWAGRRLSLFLTIASPCLVAFHAELIHPSTLPRPRFESPIGTRDAWRRWLYHGRVWAMHQRNKLPFNSDCHRAVQSLFDSYCAASHSSPNRLARDLPFHTAPGHGVIVVHPPRFHHAQNAVQLQVLQAAMSIHAAGWCAHKTLVPHR